MQASRNAEEIYKAAADEALASFQANRISFSEWRRLQKKAIEDYYAARIAEAA